MHIYMYVLQHHLDTYLGSEYLRHDNLAICEKIKSDIEMFEEQDLLRALKDLA